MVKNRASRRKLEIKVNMFTKILVGYDGSKSGKLALGRAAVMAKKFGAQITVLWVREPLPRYSDLPGEYEEEAGSADEYFQARQKEVKEIAAQHSLEVRSESRCGHPAKVIIEFAAECGCDLIVVGHSDHSGLWGRLLGDTADRIADHALAAC